MGEILQLDYYYGIEAGTVLILSCSTPADKGREI